VIILVITYVPFVLVVCIFGKAFCAACAAFEKCLCVGLGKVIRVSGLNYDDMIK